MTSTTNITIFENAIHHGHESIVRYLIKYDDEIRTMNHDHSMQLAIDQGDLSIFKILDEYGTCEDDAGALPYASAHGCESIVRYLVENGADIDAYAGESLVCAANNGHESIVRYLVENGADIHASDEWALRNAVSNRHENIVRYLVENGADVSGDYYDYKSYTYKSIADYVNSIQ